MRTETEERKFWQSAADNFIKQLQSNDIKVKKSINSNAWLYDIGYGNFTSSPFSTKKYTIDHAIKEKEKALDYFKNNYVDDNMQGFYNCQKEA